MIKKGRELSVEEIQEMQTDIIKLSIDKYNTDSISLLSSLFGCAASVIISSDISVEEAAKFLDSLKTNIIDCICGNIGTKH